METILDHTPPKVMQPEEISSSLQTYSRGNPTTVSTLYAAAAAAAKLLQSCPTLCDPIDGSPPGSAVPGILQARILEWFAISFSNACIHAKSLQSCPTLCSPRDSIPPGSSVHRILQARILEWVSISFSRQGVQILPLVRELRPHMLYSKKKKSPKHETEAIL